MLTTLLGLLASILVGLKNKAGQPLLGTTVDNIIATGESLVTSIVADVQSAGATGATSAASITDDIQTMQVLLTALKAQKVISANTLSLITALENAIAAAVAAEQAAQTTTNPSTLTPIPPAQ